LIFDRHDGVTLRTAHAPNLDQPAPGPACASSPIALFIAADAGLPRRNRPGQDIAMPHLFVDYAPGIETQADIPGLCRALRDAMVATGIFPLGGIRVRAHRADHVEIADGGPYGYVDMVLRLGAGRDAEKRRMATETVYAAAEAHLRPRIGDMPFMLSLELVEIDPAFSIRRWSTVHDALAGR
jgi:5-carboxymethyl-2-hydroxymuconate isomerase